VIFMRKGIILAGGTGSRLFPLTHATTKQLLPVYDKPLIYYPLSTLMLAGIREIMIIVKPGDEERFRDLLQDGSQWGLDLHYVTQPRPEGIAQALTLTRDFLAGGPSALILGDNIYYGDGLVALLRASAQRTEGASVFAYWVQDPERYGVVEFDAAWQPVAIVEKPAEPRSNYAVTGLYFYDGEAPDIAASLKPSARGEIEITDVNRVYLERGRLHVERFGRGYAWLDAGTHDSLLEASTFIQTVEKRQGLKIACPEEIAFNFGWIDEAALRRQLDRLGGGEYAQYLKTMLARRYR
jgi:glucose-1-phosphate thymidylyltransferase